METARRRTRSYLRRSGQVLLADRQTPDSLSGSREERVADRGCDGRDTRLAAARRRCLARHDVHLDLRHLVHPEQLIVVEVALLDATRLDGDLALERCRQAEDDAAL